MLKMETINRTFTATSGENELESAPDELRGVGGPLNEATGVDLPQIIPFGNPVMTVVGYGWPHLPMMEGFGWMWVNGGMNHLGGIGYPS